MENTSQYDFGMVGLGVMGRNLLLNMADHGFSVIGLDTDPTKAAALEGEAEAGKAVKGTTDAGAFLAALSQPRAIMLLVPAGKPVDAVIEQLLPQLAEGDILIDGGNSYFADTDRRIEYLAGKNIHFLGVGVSGGEKGARFGPSIMPGGKPVAYQRVKAILEAVAAKVNGEPCVTYLGTGSAGNYVKMVHNGIEYGIMQLIAETYDLMKRGLGVPDDELQRIYTDWNQGELQSFLVEITGHILGQTDALSGERLVNVISDRARSKGTGKWTSQNAMDLGVPVPTIDMAVVMRDLSAAKDDRVQAAKGLAVPTKGRNENGNQAKVVAQIGRGLYAAMLLTYAQGMAQLLAASKAYGYGLQLAEVARIWRGGCIIRAACLEDIRQAFEKQSALPNLLLDPGIAETLKGRQADLRATVTMAVADGIPAPALMASLAYFDAFRTATLPTNLIQAQRDYFGAHTYERIDKEGVFHTKWG
jgi:6-phosphogluconate dehydrogenase